MSVTPMEVISRGVPAFTDHQINTPADYANDSDYSTSWRSYNAVSYLAYDLSGVTGSKRHNVVVQWFNHSYGWDLTFPPHYNCPKDYTIQGNAAAGGSLPGSGWVTLATVTNNVYATRSHAVDLTGYNWVRLNVTACIGDGAGNDDIDAQMDVFNAAGGNTDTWLALGDSITAGGFYNSWAGTPALLVQAQVPTNFPMITNGGVPYLKAVDAVSLITGWLAAEPNAKYVMLSWGTNDASSSETVYYDSMVTVIEAVIARGSIPVIPKIPWGKTSDVQTYVPGLNAKIDLLYAAYPTIVHGPDLWAYYFAHQDLIGDGDVHPTSPDGYAAYAQQWADTMVTNVYNASSGGGGSSRNNRRALLGVG